MTNPSDSVENLFSYGTLQMEAVQLATFGRTLEGSADALVGYELSMLKIDDPDVLRPAAQRITRLSGSPETRKIP